MRKMLRTLGIIGLALAIARCAHSGNADRPDDWTGHMPELGRAFSDLLLYLNSSEALAGAWESDRLKSAAETLRHLTNEIKSVEEDSNVDSHLSILSARFDAEIRLASRALRKQRFPEALNRLRVVNRQCLSCHALIEARPNPYINDLPENFDRMSYFQRGDFYLGTFRYADAVYEFERGLLDPSWAQLNKREWNDHAQRLLSTVVRDRDNPAFTAEVLKRFYETNSYPNAQRKSVAHWRRHITEWKLEARKKNPPYKTALAHAALLMDQALKEAKLNGRASVRILAWRTSGILRRELALTQALARNPQFLYLSGLAQTFLDDSELGPLPEFYFERCVLLKHPATSRKCYAKLVEILGSPENKDALTPPVKARLDELSEFVVSNPAKP